MRSPSTMSLQAGYDFRAEFDFGLDLILDRIEALANQH